jgi:hypothetical protein
LFVDLDRFRPVPLTRVADRLNRAVGPPDILAADAPLTDDEAGYVEAARAANTLRGYRSDWAEFTGWCTNRGVDPLARAGPQRPRPADLQPARHRPRVAAPHHHRAHGQLSDHFAIPDPGPSLARVARHVPYAGRVEGE